jgi:hypothetical protein
MARSGGNKMNFIKWPKIPRLENEVFYISEKIDGTNACIVITDEGKVGAQSRTKLITPENDNYGFAKWVYSNTQQLFEELGPGHHFGEWWGQGIQRGYDLKEKRFSLFNPTKLSSLCSNVPIVASCPQEVLTEVLEVTVNQLITEGSRAAPGYMRPEGLVIYGEQSKAYWKVIIDK